MRMEFFRRGESMIKSYGNTWRKAAGMVILLMTVFTISSCGLMDEKKNPVEQGVDGAAKELNSAPTTDTQPNPR